MKNPYSQIHPEREEGKLLPSNDDLFPFVLPWHWSWCGKLASLLIILPLLSRRPSRTLEKSPLQPTAASPQSLARSLLTLDTSHQTIIEQERFSYLNI